VIKPLVVGAGALVVLVGAAVVNSHRVSRDAKPSPPVASTPTTQPAASALGCDDWPGLAVTEEFEVTLPRIAKADRAVVSWRCVDASGVRHPSLVHIVEYDPRSGNAHVVATLMKPSEAMHVDAVTVQGGQIIVTAAYWGPAPSGYFPTWQRPGGVLTRTFTSSDATFFIGQPPVSVAPSCGANDLATQAIAGPGPAGRAWLLKFVSRAAAPCAVEGYPTVVVQPGISTPLTAQRTLAGPLGGVRGRATAPPILVLTPGEIASAMVEAPAPAGSMACASGELVSVSLPAAGEVARLSLGDTVVCDVVVHPVVYGSSGIAR
jgi:hypothetical protein